MGAAPTSFRLYHYLWNRNIGVAIWTPWCRVCTLWQSRLQQAVCKERLTVDLSSAVSRECMPAEQSRGGGGAKRAMLKGAMFAETRPLFDKTRPSRQLLNGEENWNQSIDPILLVSTWYQYQCWYRYYCPLDGFAHPQQIFPILCSKPVTHSHRHFIFSFSTKRNNCKQVDRRYHQIVVVTSHLLFPRWVVSYSLLPHIIKEAFQQLQLNIVFTCHLSVIADFVDTEQTVSEYIGKKGLFLPLFFFILLSIKLYQIWAWTLLCTALQLVLALCNGWLLILPSPKWIPTWT